ncbi:MAG: hypothetical protein KME04_14090 [Pleurocapsa minor GSE-CHR-MK-17-07R]|jgi:hypothetical protein|nr:hypothetical protein [Pleurocapsa minor GSE-CHR-MK 17-07R]
MGFEEDGFGRPPRPSRSVLAGLPLIIGAVVVTGLGLVIFLSGQFGTRLAECRAIAASVPGLTLVSEESMGFLQLNGVLESVYTSADAPAAVEAAFIGANGAVMRQAVESGDFTNTARAAPIITANEGGGSTVRLSCP